MSCKEGPGGVPVCRSATSQGMAACTGTLSVDSGGGRGGRGDGYGDMVDGGDWNNNKDGRFIHSPKY